MLGGYIKCSVALGAGDNDDSQDDSSCGGLWFGEYEDAQGGGHAHNHRQIVQPVAAGLGTVAGSTPAGSPLFGTYPLLADAVYAHSPATGSYRPTSTQPPSAPTTSRAFCPSSFLARRLPLLPLILPLSNIDNYL